MKDFQNDHDLPSDGVAGPKTRAVLFRAYMDALAVGPSRQLVLDRSQFVGRGEDAGDKGAVQGCSEFNPVFLLSQAENAAYAKTADHTERDAKNAPNRRVMVLLFAPDAPVTAASWPCPRWNESTAGCKTQFWPDGEERRTAGEEEREYGKDRRTMACQWYDQLVRLSPCESGKPPPPPEMKLRISPSRQWADDTYHVVATALTSKRLPEPSAGSAHSRLFELKVVGRGIPHQLSCHRADQELLLPHRLVHLGLLTLALETQNMALLEQAIRPMAPAGEAPDWSSDVNEVSPGIDDEDVI